MRIVHNSSNMTGKSRVVAADENVFDDDFDDAVMEEDIDVEEDALGDQLDNLEDNLEDIQDAVEDVEEDDVDIELDNNIVDHLIAECENCKKTFISAMIESDQEVESISGICPCCGKDTVQQLKWVIKPYPQDDTLI